MSRSQNHGRYDDKLLKLYRCALWLYPSHFRAEYAMPMHQAFRDALAERNLPIRSLLATVVRDLVISVIKEHLLMLRSIYSRPALVFNAAILACIATGVALALYAIPQQVLRTGANDPQIQMATDLAAHLNHVGVTNGLLAVLDTSGHIVDIEQSLSPFLIVYDDSGRALGSTGQIDGISPRPPSGVFEYVRSHREERVTWQPKNGVRVAAVIERVEGPRPGFVLAGRNIREVEAREHQVLIMAGLTWIGMLTLIAFGTVIYGYLTGHLLPQNLPSVL